MSLSRGSDNKVAFATFHPPTSVLTINIIFLKGENYHDAERRKAGNY